ncbi:MAG: TetR/AcrR family transcriptional regulator [Mycolicibacterium neoaurum]|uniref:TetR/AcrR family transcriptional regulator n=1 Tax=Mycolicibacterium neoaurum TaxID=1795 RepID=UPI002FFC40F9
MVTSSDSADRSSPQTPAAVLDAAQTLFLRHGYAGVNLDKIAKHAGVARQTLYNNFGSKEALFRAMLTRHWDKLRALDTDPSADSHPPAEIALREFASGITDFIDSTDQIDFIRLVIAESRHSPWIAEEFYRVGKAPLLRSLVGRLDALVADGQLACPSTELAAHQFFGLIQELLLWPRVMNIGEATAALPDAATVVDEAVLTFLARYQPTP